MRKIPTSMIIENGTILTMDGENRIIRQGSVAIDGNRIVEAGSADLISSKYSAAEILDASGSVIMPGLVDTYGHAGHGLIKGIYHPELGWPGIIPPAIPGISRMP